MNSALFQLELLRLRKKFSVWFLLGLSVGIGMCISFVIFSLQDALMASESIDGLEQGAQQSMGIQSFFLQFLGTDISTIAGKALWGRNFYIIPLILVFIAADISTLRNQKLLREMLCQPITRKNIYIHKMFFLSILSLLSLICTVVPTIAISSFYLEEWGAWKDLLGGIALCWISDFAVFGIVFAASSILKLSTSGGTTLLVIFLLIIERIVSGMIYLQMTLSQSTRELGEFMYNLMPSAALNCWSQWSSEWDGFTIAYLFTLTCVIHVISIFSFDRENI